MIQVAAGICFKNGHFLMGKRPPSEATFQGYWEFPGGKFKPGETAEQALIREIREELNCEVKQLDPIANIEWQYPNRMVSLHFFWIDIFPCDLEYMQQNAHTELAWITPEEALRRPLLPANVQLVKDLIKQKQLAADHLFARSRV